MSNNASKDNENLDKNLAKQENAEEQTEQTVSPEIQRLPPAMREIMLSMTGISGPISPPFLNKINEEHIAKVLDISDKEGQRSYDDTQSSKKFYLVYVVLSLLIFVFLVVFLAEKNPILLKDILVTFGTFAGGFGAGYGIKAYKDRDSD